jgi:hypothetical protein
MFQPLVRASHHPFFSFESLLFSLQSFPLFFVHDPCTLVVQATIQLTDPTNFWQEKAILKKNYLSQCTQTSLLQRARSLVSMGGSYTPHKSIEPTSRQLESSNLRCCWRGIPASVPTTMSQLVGFVSLSLPSSQFPRVSNNSPRL